MKGFEFLFALFLFVCYVSSSPIDESYATRAKRGCSSPGCVSERRSESICSGGRCGVQHPHTGSCPGGNCWSQYPQTGSCPGGNCGSWTPRTGSCPGGNCGSQYPQTGSCPGGNCRINGTPVQSCPWGNCNIRPILFPRNRYPGGCNGNSCRIKRSAEPCLTGNCGGYGYAYGYPRPYAHFGYPSPYAQYGYTRPIRFNMYRRSEHVQEESDESIESDHEGQAEWPQDVEDNTEDVADIITTDCGNSCKVSFEVAPAHITNTRRIVDKDTIVNSYKTG